MPPKTLNPGKDPTPTTFTATPDVRVRLDELKRRAGCSRSDFLCELVKRRGDEIATELAAEKAVSDAIDTPIANLAGRPLHSEVVAGHP